MNRMRRTAQLLPLIVALTLLPLTVFAADYSTHQKVPVFVNNVGPFHNPAESYPYYSLPFCAPRAEVVTPHRGGEDNLGEVLAGDRRRASLYDIRFNVDIQWQPLCHFRLTQDEILQFQNAIRQHYMFEMFVDELPVKGFIGEIEETHIKYESHLHNETHIYLFTHLDFSIAYNQDRVIAVNLTTDPNQRLELELGKELSVEFSFSAHWVPTAVSYEDRLSLHSKHSLGDENIEIHWINIINSFVLVIMLTSFLAVVLMRALHKDFARYMELDEEEDTTGAGAGGAEDDLRDSGWKLVHGDVFRTPKFIMLLSASVGVGAQLFVLIVILLILALMNIFYPGNRGSLYSACIIAYIFTSSIAGYVSTNLYMQLGGLKWAMNSILASSLFAIPFGMCFALANSVAMYHGTSTSLPFTTIMVIFLVWLVVCVPCTILGSARARSVNTSNGKMPSFEAPCKTNRVEREIPPTPWYRTLPVHLLITGFLPFSAIYIELHYIFASVWGHRVYTLFGILTLAFIMLIIVTAFITVALTYFQLASEDYHWWWRSFLSGAATGLFMYAYGIFYYMYHSEMSGVLQGVFFFGYVAAISYAFALMLGAVSFTMAMKFVLHIYRSIKID